MYAAHFREETHVPVDDAEREAIRQQLERMLANPLFKYSKRYPNLLRYVVENTLEGRTGELKERSLGVAVFGREPDYDTNVDPVVRATAGEIRKRIAQYYHEPGHAMEVRIDLSPRSYIPEFEMPARVQPPAVAPIQQAAPAASHPAMLRWRALALASAVGLLVVATVWLKPWARQIDLDRFWKPVLDSSNTVLLCMGQREFLGSSPERGQVAVADLPGVSSGPITLFQLYYLGSQNLSLTDVSTIGRLTGLLQAKGKTFHIRGQLSTDFADLRDGPVVLVGAFDNDWTMRLTGPMRFSFERDHDTFWLKDRQSPARRDRAVNYRTPYLSLTEDYALISRTLDPTTGRMVVVVGGLTGYGTIAAGEFLTDPTYLEAMAKGAPSGWERKNIQVVLATRVIHGTSGPPRILERHFW
ncbi:MAG: hypothetical protein ABSE42_10820 [Bryobacteraceae bacterium]|jgi:hypothetical protein